MSVGCPSAGLAAGHLTVSPTGVRACVRVCVCVCGWVRACVCVCVCVCVFIM